ncbi:MAG TPA: FAD-dependent oxidoreductase [Myxococcota bacterium]|nr:FAD-dependent oxidoreductase [Myxococcota bacterium]
MKIAIVGSGISGLVAARLLHARHEICVYEAADRIGGHTHTVEVSHAGETHAIDTGFIVYNEATYPLFTRLLARLGVATQASSMSFGLSCERSGVEWASHGLRSLFAQPGNLLRPAFLRMLRDVLRFNREARGLLEAGDEKVSLGDYLRGARYSDAFVEHYARPMGAAIWSADPERLLEIPALTFMRFFDNHGLLAANPSLAWRTIRGGSARYLDKLVAPYREQIRTGCRVRCVRRSSDRVEILSDAGVDRFDHVVLATHSDQALALLEAPTQLERKVLGAIRYQRNDVALHTDESILPHSPRAWASWNYRVPRDAQSRVVVTYDMSRLQSLSTRTRFLVTLNGGERIDPAQVLRRFVYHHPIFDRAAIQAQKLHLQLSGLSRTHFCGAYWGYGFHEDGVRSAIAACAPFGAGF